MESRKEESVYRKDFKKLVGQKKLSYRQKHNSEKFFSRKVYTHTTNINNMFVSKN